MDSSVNLRIQRDAQPPFFHSFHASDTLRNVLLQVGAVNAWEEGNVSLFDVGRSPAVALSNIDMTLEALGLFPGGSLSIETKAKVTDADVKNTGKGSFSCPSSSDATISVTSSRPLPSEVLSSHITRFKDSPLISSTAHVNVLGNDAIERRNLGGGNGEVGAAVAAALGRGKAAKTNKGRSVSNTVRRILIKSQAVGRQNLRHEDRFHLEIVVPSAAAASTSCELPSEMTSDQRHYFLYFPRSWTLSRIVEDALKRILSTNYIANGAGLVPVVRRTSCNLLNFSHWNLRDLEMAQVCTTTSASAAAAEFNMQSALEEFDVLQLLPEGGAPVPIEPPDRALLPQPPPAPPTTTTSTTTTTTTISPVLPTSDKKGHRDGNDCLPPKLHATTDARSVKWTLHVKYGKVVLPLKNVDPTTDTVRTLKEEWLVPMQSCGTLDAKLDVLNARFVYKGNLDETLKLAFTTLKDGAKITILASGRKTPSMR